MSSEPYAYGEQCTWHGPLTFARPGIADGDLVYDCPKCRLPLKTTTAEEFWRLSHHAERENPGHDAMLRWSQGKCFPDFETMQNAWRQAMEGLE